ncbi:sensor histidine kinase [Streptomyces yaizuensis]|uniref:Histidine kinase n=1 Tax=Streptomyces yaizuensis TaxID=2989713 RepID=A0ABQ5NZ33_9ACTN|nr:histidine kinase [Streptomyces sp. YSPA8]GLF95624.1 histidine kinase [Streptomyces sp. YSPA8]
MEATASSGRAKAGSSTADDVETGTGGIPALSTAVRTLGVDAPPPQVALSILVLVMSGFMLVGFLNILEASSSPTILIVTGAGFVAIFGLQLVHSAHRLRRLRARWGRWTLALQALLTYLPLFTLGLAWGGMGGFLGASVLLVLPARAAWPLFGAVGAIACVTGPLLDQGVISSVYIGVSTILTGLIVYGLSRLANLVVEVQGAQQALARLAVGQERLRFARDLHDLLGYSLSAITLKSELARRLVHCEADRALVELENILEISRQALADVRTVARGYRDMSLATEAVSARAVLEAGGIHATVEIRGQLPEGETSTIMATVLREAVTNLLRHSKAEHCRIESWTTPAGRLVLTIANDGVEKAGPGAAGVPSGRDGSGLHNLQFRLAAIGGRLSSGIDDKGWFVLTAEAPIAVEHD